MVIIRESPTQGALTKGVRGLNLVLLFNIYLKIINIYLMTKEHDESSILSYDFFLDWLADEDLSVTNLKELSDNLGINHNAATVVKQVGWVSRKEGAYRLNKMKKGFFHKEWGARLLLRASTEITDHRQIHPETIKDMKSCLRR